MADNNLSSDTSIIQATSDVLLQRTSESLSELLQELVKKFEPFPSYPGAFFAYGIEIDAPKMIAADLGCVILGNDGGLYEFQIGLDTEQIAAGADPMSTREESLIPLDLPDIEYIPLAYEAIRIATLRLEQTG